MLTLEGCRTRQERFARALEAAGIEAALITEPRDIYYLTGLLPEAKVFPYPNALFLGPGRKSWLVTGLAGGEAVADERIVYPTNTMFTLNPDNHRRACELIRDRASTCQGLNRVGWQREATPHSVVRAVEQSAAPREWVEIDSILQDLQLRKDPDEVECIQRAVSATLAGYDAAQRLIAPGVRELDVLAAAQKAAQDFVGGPCFHGGDYRSGEFGGPARDRAIEAGELYIIDAWSDVDGYWCDMARTFSVDGEPTELQASIYEHIAGILRSVPKRVRLGGDTSAFWQELDAQVREHPHLADVGMKDHGGHGVGLRVHEMPDLNRDRGGVFEVGTVFTCEPAAYSEALNAGVRLESVFVIEEHGVRELVPYPLSIQVQR